MARAIGLLSELLLKNDDNFTWLSLTNNEIGIPIVELTKALLCNRTLRKVSCHAGFLGSLQVADLALLMETLSKLTHVQEMWLALPPRQASRSAAVLKTVLVSSSTESESEQTDGAVTDTTTANNTTNSTTTATTSRLQKLTFRGIDDAGCFVLAQALRDPSSCLTDLQIRGATSSSTSSPTAAEAVNVANNNNNNIMNNNNNPIPAFLDNHNNIAMQQQQQQQQPQSKVTRQGVVAMAEMLKVNRTLERLDMCYKGLDGTSCRAMAEALKNNHKLQKLDLTSPTITTTTTTSNNNNAAVGAAAAANNNNNNNNNRNTTNNNATATTKQRESLIKGWDAMVETMRENYTLQYLNTQAENEQKYMMELFTKLNRTGARALMRNSTDHTGLEDALEVLLKQDLSATYELLSLNPALWDPVKATVQGLETTKNVSKSKTFDNCCDDDSNYMKKRLSLVKPSVAASFTNNNNGDDDNASLTATSTTGTNTTTTANNSSGTSKKRKPVMARWNENIFSKLEREKIKNFKRWTPTVIETMDNDSDAEMEETSSSSSSSSSTSSYVVSETSSSASSQEERGNEMEDSAVSSSPRSVPQANVEEKELSAQAAMKPQEFMELDCSLEKTNEVEEELSFLKTAVEISEVSPSKMENVADVKASSKEECPPTGIVNTVIEEQEQADQPATEMAKAVTDETVEQRLIQTDEECENLAGGIEKKEPKTNGEEEQQRVQQKQRLALAAAEKQLLEQDNIATKAESEQQRSSKEAEQQRLVSQHEAKEQEQKMLGRNAEQQPLVLEAEIQEKEQQKQFKIAAAEKKETKRKAEVQLLARHAAETAQRHLAAGETATRKAGGERKMLLALAGHDENAEGATSRMFEERREPKLEPAASDVFDNVSGFSLADHTPSAVAPSLVTDVITPAKNKDVDIFFSCRKTLDDSFGVQVDTEDFFTDDVMNNASYHATTEEFEDGDQEFCGVNTSTNRDMEHNSAEARSPSFSSAAMAMMGGDLLRSFWAAGSTSN